MIEPPWGEEDVHFQGAVGEGAGVEAETDGEFAYGFAAEDLVEAGADGQKTPQGLFTRQAVFGGEDFSVRPARGRLYALRLQVSMDKN